MDLVRDAGFPSGHTDLKIVLALFLVKLPLKRNRKQHLRKN